MHLKTFNFYQHVKDNIQGITHEDVFYSNQDTYKDTRINFPYRTTEFAIAVCYGPEHTKCRLGSVEYPISKGSLITLGPGIVTSYGSQYDLKFEIVYFTEVLFHDLIVPKPNTLPFFVHGGKHMLIVNTEDLNRLKVLFQSIKTFRENRNILQGLVYSLVQLVQQIHLGNQRDNSISSKELITQKFKALIARHFIKSKEVGFYANQFHITPKYLSEVLQEITGKTAKELINEHLFLEAKSLLRQTPMTIKEIAYWLGFEDQSYFVRAFKKNVGTTPAIYRKGG
ncbi:MAG TPA: helix-turn-helix domain-containing protein [Saprospiraceae bacterium]|nr:helix-turn-helix domain-containing protein [Saprospiraceae bacterium]